MTSSGVNAALTLSRTEGCEPGEPGDHRGERLNPGRGHGDDVQAATAHTPQCLYRGLRGIEVAHHEAGRPDELLARFAEDRPAADAVEERHAEVLLQPRDGLGQRRLGDQQVLCRAVESVMVNNGQEILQLPRVHASPFAIRSFGLPA